MCSFRESKVEKYLNNSSFERIVDFSSRQLIRVYPEGSRIYSSNYNPTRMWNCAIQMVALNYQTKDKPMQLNMGKFMQNGNCGYVLMPSYIRDPHFNPFSRNPEFNASSPIILTVQVNKSLFTGDYL